LKNDDEFKVVKSNSNISNCQADLRDLPYLSPLGKTKMPLRITGPASSAFFPFFSETEYGVCKMNGIGLSTHYKRIC